MEVIQIQIIMLPAAGMRSDRQHGHAHSGVMAEIETLIFDLLGFCCGMVSETGYSCAQREIESVICEAWGCGGRSLESASVHGLVLAIRSCHGPGQCSCHLAHDSHTPLRSHAQRSLSGVST